MLMLRMAGKSGEGGVVAPPVGADVRTDSSINLSPGFPTAGLQAGDIFFAHTTVHADSQLNADGSAAGWLDVSAQEEGDLANTVEYRVATGSESGVTSIDWEGVNGSGEPSTPTLLGTGAAVASTNPAVDLAVPYPEDITILANDLIMIQVGIRDGTAATATATNFSALFTADVGPGQNTQHWLVKFAVGGENVGSPLATVAVNWDGNVGGVVALAQMHLVRGVALDDFVEGHAVQDSTAGASDPILVPSLVTSGLNRLGFAALSAVAVRTFAEIEGETGGDYNSPLAEVSTGLGSGYTMGINTVQMPSPGTVSGGNADIVVGGAINWMAVVFALKPAQATGGTGGQRVAASMVYRFTGPNVAVKNVAVTNGTGTTVTFPTVAFGAGSPTDIALAFLSVNGQATQETNPTSPWVFQSRGETNAGDGASWFLYRANTAPVGSPAATLTINAGDRWSVIAFALGIAEAPPVIAPVVSQRQSTFSDTGTATLAQVPVNGNLLVAVSFHRGTGSSAVISGTGWTQRILHTTDLGTPTLQKGLSVWTKSAGAVDPTSITTTWTPTTPNRIMVTELQGNRAVTWTFENESVAAT